MWDAKNIQPNSVYFFFNYHEPRSQSFASQYRTKYHINTGSPIPTEIKLHVRGDITDVKGKQNEKSTAGS